MDVVYILGAETAWDNNELRYSLRSVIKHLSGVDKIFIIGAEPGFITSEVGTIPLIWISHHDNMDLTKERRIMEKVKFACSQREISDNFFFLNDDIFLLSDCHTETLPNYYKGTLLNSAKKRDNDRYRRALMNSHNALLKAKVPAQLNFDTHTPIIYNKKEFIRIMDLYDWRAAAARDGYVVKSLYANTMKVEGVFMPDCKIDEPLSELKIKDRITDRIFLSVGDNGLNDSMKQVLMELYTNKCAWEVA